MGKAIQGLADARLAEELAFDALGFADAIGVQEQGIARLQLQRAHLELESFHRS